VPAVFYVPTRFIGDRIPLWFDAYRVLLSALGRPPAGLEPEVVRQIPFDVLTARLEQVCSEHGIAPDPENDDIRLMSWDEARELARRGFTIGAHGLRHAILTLETDRVARAEIAESITEVTRHLDAPCESFAFPNGNYTPRLAQYAQQCGARTVMTTEPTWTGRQTALWRLPRVQLFGEFSRAKIELKLALAATGWLLSNPDGTGRAYRRKPAVSRSRRPLPPTPSPERRGGECSRVRFPPPRSGEGG
jgi:peptidoglycan/xylan/chitin deacetylase (PgdA/CDA1 family)